MSRELLMLSEEALAAELARRFEGLADDDYRGRFDRAVDHSFDYTSFVVRMPLCREFAFAVPTDEALDAISELGPIVELGAGTGYWAYLLGKRGVDVVAYDWRPVIEPYNQGTPFRRVRTYVTLGLELESDRDDGVTNQFKFTRQWAKVMRGTPEVLAHHGTRALFLCWPDYDSTFASEALDAYTRAGGTAIAYIGEGPGGCTGDDLFHKRLHREWRLERRIRLPQWPSVHDDLSIYRALPPGEPADLGAALRPSDWSGASVSVVGGDFGGGKGKVT